MNDDVKPFEECLDAFASHEYERTANLALNLFFQRRRFFWIMQVLLISLERIGDYRALRGLSETAYSSFAEHAWSLALLDLTLRRASPDALRSAVSDPIQRCQLDFYQASCDLTLGDRPAAMAGFLAVANSGVQRPEQYLAIRECANPEPPDRILERLVLQVTHKGQGAVCYDTLTTARSVFRLLRDEELQDPSIALPCLEIVLLRLESLKHGGSAESIRSQLQELYRDRDAAWERGKE